MEIYLRQFTVHCDLTDSDLTTLKKELKDCNEARWKEAHPGNRNIENYSVNEVQESLESVGKQNILFQ